MGFFDLFRKKKITRLQVNFHILRTADGQGNDLWSYAHCEQVLRVAHEHLGMFDIFRLGIRNELHHDTYHHQSMVAVHDFWREPLRTYRALPVLITGPNTTDAAGYSHIQWSTYPFFAMRARDIYNLNETAQIFLHELGHNLNLRHSDQVGEGELHADNYWQREDGRQRVRDYINWLAAR